MKRLTATTILLSILIHASADRLCAEEPHGNLAPLEIVQKTDSPWSGKATTTIIPSAQKQFCIKIRVSEHAARPLYLCRDRGGGPTVWLAATSKDIGAKAIRTIEPPEKRFFSKRLDYEGIPIKAHRDVDDAALLQAYARLEKMLGRLPQVCRRLADARTELHIIGRNQVTTDLPEWRQDKGKRLPEYNGLTRDQRTRGMGGRLTSCGEENLLRLEKDRYRGRDICIHEFAHCIQDYGMTPVQRERFRKQHQQSLAAGKWVGAYAGSNESEYFAELSMWYWGTHGDLGMKGDKPADGPNGLKAYDRQAYDLIDDFYSGKS
jgi:hypothetical protein